MQARYVECLIKVGGQDALFNRKAALTLALPGTAGIQAHASVTDDAKRRRMVMEKDKAAVAAGLGLLGAAAVCCAQQATGPLLG